MQHEETRKDFGPIRGDYEFFLAHSTEYVKDLAAYGRELQRLARDRPRLAMLDFGCGDGRFTDKLLNQCRFPEQQLELALIEPQQAYRETAVNRLQPSSRHPLRAWAALPATLQTRFDLILANHSLYYVPDLQQTVAGLLSVLSDTGLFVTAMAGRENALIQFWIRCFAMLQRPVPYHLAEDLETVLQQAGRSFQADPVQYELRFPDVEENRCCLLRFLLSDDFAALPRQAALDLFQPWSVAGEIVMPITHRHFVVTNQ